MHQLLEISSAEEVSKFILQHISCKIALQFTNNKKCKALETTDTLLSISLYKTDPNTTVR